MLKQDAASAVGRFRSDKLRGLPGKLPPAGEPRDKYYADHRDAETTEPHSRAEIESELRVAVNYLVRYPDDIRYRGHAQREAEHTADKRRAARIPQVFAYYRAGRIAHRLERAYLGALFVYHAGHGRGADQRRDERKEHRERVPDRAYDCYVVFKGRTAGILVAREDIQVELQLLIRVGLRLIQLRLCVDELLPPRRKLIQCAAARGLKRLSVFRNLGGGAVKLRPSRRYLLAVGLCLLFGVVQLRLRGVKLGARGIYLLLSRVKLGLCRSDLRLCRGKLGFAVGQLCLLIGKLRGGVIEVLLCLREFGLQTLQPRLEHRQRQLPAELRPVERVYRRLSRAYLALEPVDDRLIRRKRKLLRGLKLAARRRQLRLLLCDLRLGGCKLRAPRVYLLLLFVQQGAVLLYLLPRGRNTRQSVLKLLFRIVERGAVLLYLALRRLDLRKAVVYLAERRRFVGVILVPTVVYL